MAAQKAEGIILRKHCLRETSFILVVFTKEFGKIQGVIKGVRAPYPQFAGNFEIFTLCQLLFYKKKQQALDLITQCELLDFFLPARKDIERVTYANYFIELVNIVTTDYDPNEALYNTLVEGLRMLKDGLSARRTARIFELKLLQAIGLSPEIEKCTACGEKVVNKALFNPASGGIMCGVCAAKNRMNIQVSKGTTNFIKKIQETDMDKTLHIKVSRDVGMETERVLKQFLKYHINRETKSLKFLKMIEKSNSPL